MTKPFHIDNATLPQEVRVEFGRVTLDDYEMSLSTVDLGQERIDEACAGKWHFIGIQAEATAYIPIGQGCFAVYTLTSPGVWGIESDLPPKDLDDMYNDEKKDLITALKAIGAAVAKQFPED